MDLNLFLIKDRCGQLYNGSGNRLTVTYLQIPALVVLESCGQTKDKTVWRIGIKEKPLTKCAKPQRLLLEKVGSGSGFYFVREIKIDPELGLKPGDRIAVEKIIHAGDFLAVKGLTKGRGFAGAVKRWRFRGGPKTHGQSDRERAVGSIGQRTTPGRVWKGKKMPGHMGNKEKTVLNLNVLAVDPTRQEVILKGLVPGTKGSLVGIGKLNRKPKTISLGKELPI